MLGLASFEASPYFTDDEKLVLRLAVQLTGTPAEVDDSLYAALRNRFSEHELVELSAAIAWENYRARFNRAFNVGAEGFSEGSVCAVPER